jgi:hypothetical protein
VTISYSSFHLRYDRGQGAVWGNTPGLIEHFEGFGGGLPQDDVWRSGGPLLVPGREKTERILAWIRGMSVEETGRQNAWEAWGIIGPTRGFKNWITFWDALAAPPTKTRLDDLADAFNRGSRGAAYPPLPPRLASLLADIHTTQREGAFGIKLTTPSEIALLPWSCLLGNVSPEEVALGGPRRRALAFPLSYEAIIIDAPLTAPQDIQRSISPAIDLMLSRAQQGNVEGAMQLASDLRRMKPEERLRAIFPPPPAPPPPEPVIATQSPRIDAVRLPEKVPRREPRVVRRRFFVPRRWQWPIVMGLCTAILAMQIWSNFFQKSSSSTQPPQSAKSETASPATQTGTIGATHTSAAVTATTGATAPVDCTDWWKQPASRTRVLQQAQKKLAGMQQIRVGGAATTLLNGQDWDAATGDGLATAVAVQLQIDVTQCGNIRVDGDAGKATQKARVACENQGRKIDNGDAALQWLCNWTSQP